MSETDNEELMKKMLESLTSKMFDTLKDLAAVQYRGLYLSSVVKSLSSEFVENIKTKLPKIGEIMKLFLTFLEKQSLSIHDASAKREAEDMLKKASSIQNT